MIRPRSDDSRLRAVFVSDVHLGSRYCRAEELAVFLTGLRCRQLYLVGDIVDLWWLAHKRAVWGAAELRVVEALHLLARQGTELIYIPGNHDRPIRHFCGLILPRMTVRRRAIHTLLDGRRLLVTHGDDYDAVTHFGNFQEAFGNWLYYVILTGNQMTNAWRRLFGLRYWSLAEFLKRHSAAAERFIERFVRAGLDDARRRGVDGILCGHIHRADLRVSDGLIYANDGDWVESMSAIVEDVEGHLRLFTHGGRERSYLPSALPPVRRQAEAA
jgi:UDP-2,3-diacylglucosamine pyrophosphatase LpxH